MKKHNVKVRRTTIRFIAAVIEFLLIIGIIVTIICGLQSIGVAETTTFYALCRPGDYVHARKLPSRNSTSLGRFETGDEIQTDGKTKDGFVHVVNAPFEEKECWVHCGYIVFDRPEKMFGRTATVVCNGNLLVRQCVDGKVVKKLKNGTELQIFYWSGEWAVTNRGYVRTEFIELDGE